MSGNPQERYERIALDLTKIIVEQKNKGGSASAKNDILQTYIDSYNAVIHKSMPIDNK